MRHLKDYLHLYLGGEILLSGNIIKLDTESLNHAEYFDHYSVIRLILRKISDITEDELKQLAAWSGTCSPNDWDIVQNDRLSVKHKNGESTFRITDSGDCIAKNSEKWRDFSISSQQSRMFKHLLDWGFDLFSLIPAGLAIDRASFKSLTAERQADR